MLVTTIEIARPPSEVWALATDPRRFAEWQRDVVGVELLDGSRFTTTRRVAGRPRTMTQRITHDDPFRHWSAEALDGPVRPRASVTIEPISDGAGSRVTFTLDFDASGFGAALVPLVTRQARHTAPQSYETLKRLLEGAG